ncbi:alpha-hydroxy acid oxidase [Micromonospora sp. DT201]|uniref:alpha-hydroxy acid oxidase n=1 Tax=Micromonospora sp. DT201 TaxID=3393442 RepID=UPI003CEB223D
MLTDRPTVSLADYAERARVVLPPDVWDYAAGGSAAEVTLTANRRELDRIAVLPRVLRGVGTVDLRTQLLGRPYAMPVGVAPLAYQRLVHPDGELALAAAAGAAGVPYVASTLGSTPIEQVTGAGAEVWFQLYWLRERALVRDLLDRVVAAGCRALVLTVDVPVLGRHPRDLRNEFRLPADVVAANLPDGRGALAHAGAPGVSAVATSFAPALRWADLAWLREQVDLPLVVKGVLDPRDAVEAVRIGADAVVVSNHGGRQLDGAPASITMLPEVVDAVGDRCQVLLDSGIRSGTDVLRALALGAAGVLVGRPLLWALAVGGQSAARDALALLAAELTDALTLAGCPDPAAAGDLRTVEMG